MDKRKYIGAGIGVDRMNQIMDMLLFGEASMTDISLHLCLCDRAVKGYIRQLLEGGKIAVRRGVPDGRVKLFSLAHGAMPFQPIEPVWGPRKSRSRGLRTGPKPKEPVKQVPIPRPPSVEKRNIRVAPAQQIGMPRDPFQALFFGAPA